MYTGVYCYIGAVTCYAGDVICCGLYFERDHLIFWSPCSPLTRSWIISVADGMTGEGELQCSGGEGVLHREIIWGSTYLRFLKANLKQILGRTIPWKYGVKFFPTLGIIWRDLKVSRKFVCIQKFWGNWHRFGNSELI